MRNHQQTKASKSDMGNLRLNRASIILNATHTKLVAGLIVLSILLSSAAFGAVTRHEDWRNALKPIGKPGPRLNLASDGKTQYCIAIPSSATTMEEKAADDLAQWLGEMTGAKFETVIEAGSFRTPDKYISIGLTDIVSNAGLSGRTAGLGDEGYAIDVVGNDLYIQGGKTRGIINGVYALLEEDLGCRWYAANTASIPNLPNLRFRPVPRTFVPVLTERRDPLYTDCFSADWSLRNRTYGIRSPVPEELGGYPKWNLFFVHTFDLLMPPSEFFDKHPEYYSELNGKRRPRQLCTTNPDVADIIIGRVRAKLKEDPSVRIIDVSPNDWTDYCECANCKAINDAEGTYMGALLHLVNKVADAVAKDYPNVRVTTLAYLGTVVPPKNIRPKDNVLIWLCTDSHAWSNPLLYVWETEKFQNALKSWHAIGANSVIWDYPIDFGRYMNPLPNMPVVTENMRFYAKYGAKGIMLQAEHNPCYGVDRSFMRCWVWAKQLWDLSLDAKALIRDFNYGYYGKAAEPMQKYDELLWKLWEKHHKDFRTREYCGSYYDKILDSKFIASASQLFDQAENLATGDHELLDRVRLAKLPILYVKARRGPTSYVRDYLKLLDELKSIARKNNVTHIENPFGPPDLDPRLDYWRKLSLVRPEKLSYLELPNEWKFKTDPESLGIDQKWYATDYDDSSWSVVKSNTGTGWESQGFPDNTGYGWYRMQFDAPQNLKELKNLRMLFEAVDEEAEVYVNRQHAFDHTCRTTGLPIGEIWTTPFAFDPLPFLMPGERNPISVRVHNNMAMGGVWKPVYLIWGEQILDPQIVTTVIAEKSTVNNGSGDK